MPTEAPTSTIRDVELVSAGEWAASTGVTAVTRTDLEAILAASRDTDVDAAPIRIGHVDPRFDGEPAAGWVKLTRIVDVRRDGKAVPTLVGDLVGMPTKLAYVAPAAFRRRSVEIAWDVTTAAGRQYRAALVGLALLGVAAPAVKGLADVLALYGQGQAPSDATALELVDGLEDNPVAVAMLTAARKAGAAPAAVDAMAAAAGASDTSYVPPPIPEPPHDDTDRATSRGAVVADKVRTLTDAELRTLIGREADVDVEATLASIRATAQPEEPTGDDGGDEAASTGPATEGDPAKGEPGRRADEAESKTPALVTLSAGTLDQLRADATAGRQAAETLAAQRRDALLDDAVKAGKVAPAERSAFAAALAADEAAGKALLDTIAPRYAVSELGAAASPEADPSDEAWSAFERSIGVGLDK